MTQQFHLGVYPTEMSTCVYQKKRYKIHTAVLFIKPQTGVNPNVYQQKIVVYGMGLENCSYGILTRLTAAGIVCFVIDSSLSCKFKFHSFFFICVTLHNKKV